MVHPDFLRAPGRGGLARERASARERDVMTAAVPDD
jgi:hypothetical protein